MNIERDKFLTEYFGECWHDHQYRYNVGTDKMFCCIHCNDLRQIPYYRGNPKQERDFSTLKDFGWLWEKCQQQVWWDVWIDSTVSTCFTRAEALEKYVHPDRFADAVYKFLEERR